METNLLALVQGAMGSDFAKQAGQFLGESPGATQSAISSLLPAVLGAVAQKGATAEGASGLMSLINNSGVGGGMLDNVAGMLGGGGAGVSDLLRMGSSQLVPSLFGDKAGSLVNALSSSSGIKASSATNLLALVVPMVLGFIKKIIAERGLNAGSLASLLGGQGQFLKGALDRRITNALGFASPAAFLGGLGGAAADTARRTGAAVASGAATASNAAYTAGAAAVDTGRSALSRWLPWIIGALILLLLWWLFAGRTSTPPAPATPPKVAAPAPAPAPMAAASAGFPAKIYFESGSTTIGADGSKVVAAAAEEIKKGSMKVTLTGYTDKTGDTAKNEEIAKNRALAVRDALKAAGVAEANIEMKPPMFVETGGGGAAVSDAEARRVEINRN
jgi:hypothetical protein